MTHRFILEPYKGIASRHTCPECKHTRCFSRYIDTQGAISFPECVGRCDREQKCGYHYTPKEYFEQNPPQQTQTYERVVRPVPPPLPRSYIDAALVERSMSRYTDNRLFQFLSSHLSENEALRLMKLYRVGTANYWQGSTVFWQTDNHGKVRTGKIMLYNPTTGRRIKEPHNHITWVHSIVHKEGFNLKQCFFGEHLLPTEAMKSVAIVESEKSALIASSYLPQYLRQFSYSKIDYAWKQNTWQEQQSLQPTQHAPTTPTHTVAEPTGSILGGLFDIPLDTNGMDHEEEQFRRRMQKKKRQRRI